MDNDSEKHPIRDSALDNITPEFTKHGTNDEASAASELSEGENKAAKGGGLYNKNSDSSIANSSRMPGKGALAQPNPIGIAKMVKGFGKKGQGAKLKKASAATLIMVGLFGVMIFVVGRPLYMIGNMDFNLMQSLGFSGTVSVLEKQTEHVTEEMALEGEIPKDYADDLVAAGLDVGQVTVAGDFVRTNKYIANIEDLKDVAVVGSGFYANKTEDGQLAFLFEDKVIAAEDFVESVESNPRLYAALSKGADISARYYYEDSSANGVSKIYEELGLKRYSFYQWKPTGDAEKDQKSFENIMVGVLNGDGNGDLTGCRYRNITDNAAAYDGHDYSGGMDKYDCKNEELNDKEWENIETITSPYEAITSVSGKDGGEVTGSMADSSFDVEDATGKAAQVLNSTISSAEPILAMRSFIAIEEPLQMTRINEEGGPGNEVMTTLYKSSEVEYTDVKGDKAVKVKKPIIETNNFVAAVSQGSFSKSEAQNFSRDRVLNITNTKNQALVPKTMSNNDKQKEYKPMMGYEMEATLEPVFDDQGNFINRRVEPKGQADAGVLSKADNSVSVAVEKKNSNLYPSPIGGNRIINGGAILNDILNQHSIAALSSDQNTVLAYEHEVSLRLAKKAEADRATKSPFDITSPHTFMGSIMSSFSNAMIRSGVNKNESSLLSSMNVVADLTSDSANNIVNGAIADGADSSFATTFGDGCEVVPSVGVAGHLDCSEAKTIETGMMSKTKKEWENEIDKDEYEKFVGRAMDKWTPSGVVDANICEELNQEGGFLSKILYKVLELLGLADSYDKCKNSEEARAEASGLNYALSDSNSSSNIKKIRKFSAYTLHDKVYSLLSGEKSEAAKIIEKRRAEKPLDNSAAGQIARFTGVTKEDAQLALDYAKYLIEVAQYDASDRYAFGQPEFIIPVRKNALVEHSQMISSNLYCFWRGQVDYGDVRNRSLIA